MDQSGRFRSRIGKPSGLRPPTVRGAAAAAGPCPAVQGTAPCPAAEKTGPSRLQQILRPARSLRSPTVRGAAAAAGPCPAVQGTSPWLVAERAGPSRLLQMPRPASGLRSTTVRGAAAAAGPCPAVKGIAPCPAAERSGLSRLQQIPRAASRLPDPRLQRAASPPGVPSPSRGAIPKRTRLRPPSVYAASSRLPAAPRPARVIPQPEPTPEAPIASTVPVARVISPARTLAVPIPQDSLGAAATICPAAVATPLRRRLPQPSRLRRPAVKTENVVAVPVVQAPGSPLKRILIPESVAASDEETIIAVPRVTPLEQVDRKFAEMERRLSLEGAAAPCSPRSPRVRRSAPYAISEEALETTLNRIDEPKPVPVIEVPVTPREAAAVINQVVENAATALVEQEKEEEGTKPFYYLTRSPGFATMSYIDAKWDRLMRDSYGDEYADSLLAERLPLSPVVPHPIPSFLDRLGATMPPKEDTVMPKYYSLSSEGQQVSPKRSVRRRLVFEDENLPSSSPRVRRSAPYAISEEALETALNRIDEPKPVPVIEVPVTPREAAAVINQVVENAATAVVEQEKEEEGTESSYYLARSPGFADRAFRLLLSPEIPSSLPAPILDPFTMRYIDSKWDRLMRDLYGDECADSLLAERLPLSPIVPHPIPSFLDRLGATMLPKEDTVMPKYYSLSSEGEQVSPKRSVRRRLVFKDENLPSSSPRVRRSAPYAISEEALETTLNRIDEPKPVPVIEVPVTPREAAAVINQVVENAATAVVEQEKEEEGTESSYYLARSPGFADRAFRLLLSPEIPSSLPVPILDPFTMRYIDSKWDRLMRDSYGDEYADSLAERPPLSPIVPHRIPSFLDSLGATMPPKEDTVMPKYYSLSSEQVSPEIDPEAAFVLASIVEAVAQVEESDDELIEDITPPPEFFEPDAAEGLPRPLIPQRVWPRTKGRIIPKLGSPLGERSRYPVAYLKMLSGYKSPEYIDSPFSNPPKNPPYHKYLDRYITIDELEAFLAGTWPELEEEKVERGIWAERTPPEDTHSEYFDTRFYDRYPGYRRYERY